jgi:hypothetical protein
MANDVLPSSCGVALKLLIIVSEATSSVTTLNPARSYILSAALSADTLNETALYLVSASRSKSVNSCVPI